MKGKFEYNLGHEISDTDKHNMIYFAQVCRKELRSVPELLKRIDFSIEGKFSLPGFVNEQNYGVWRLERLQQVYKTLHNTSLSQYSGICQRTKQWDLISSKMNT